MINMADAAYAKQKGCQTGSSDMSAKTPINGLKAPLKNKERRRLDICVRMEEHRTAAHAAACGWRWKRDVFALRFGEGERYNK